MRHNGKACKTESQLKPGLRVSVQRDKYPRVLYIHKHTRKLTYRDSLLLLYLVLEQELWFAGDINDSKKEVHHNIDEKCIVHGT